MSQRTGPPPPPVSRESILAMARDWQGVAGTNASAWGIAQSVLQGLGDLTQASDNTLAAAKNETTRTPVATAKCKEAFVALSEAMRDMRLHPKICRQYGVLEQKLCQTFAQPTPKLLCDKE